MSTPVPVFDLGGAYNRGSSPWETIAAMNCGGGGFGGANSMWAFLPWLLLFGWGGFGGGGFGGYGGGGGRCCGGFGGNFAADLAVTDATNIAELKAGANFAAQGINGLRNGLADLNVNLCNNFANVNTNITNAAYQNQLGQRDLQMQISDCCCKTQTNIAASTNALTQQLSQLNYNLAMQTCEIKQAIAADGDATRRQADAIERDKLRAMNAKLEQENFILKNCPGTNC